TVPSDRSLRERSVTRATVMGGSDIALGGGARVEAVTSKRVLYVGGTGTISAACVRRSVEAGDDVTVLNRGSARRPLPDGVRELVADVRDPSAMREVIADADFDVVAQFLAFTPDHV